MSHSTRLDVSEDIDKFASLDQLDSLFHIARKVMTLIRTEPRDLLNPTTERRSFLTGIETTNLAKEDRILLGRQGHTNLPTKRGT